MKRLFMLLGLMIVSLGLIATPVYAAEGDPVEDPITEEVVEDELTLEEEEALFQAELSETIAEVFA